MEMLELICKKLGVEVGEEWRGTGNFKYKIADNTFYISFNDIDFTEADADEYEMLCKGEIKPLRKPKKGEKYYMPYTLRDELYTWEYWENSIPDLWRLDRNLIYKTKEGAIEVAKKMLDAIQEGV